MKEEGINRKLPPKMINGASSGSTPTKVPPNDEILSTLLRINNFDSISSIKDESLDIDLSACVTISSDSMGMMNGNSLSSTDFWRVLDESAQNPQLYLTTGADDGIVHVDLLSEAGSSLENVTVKPVPNSEASTGKGKSALEQSVKREFAPTTTNSFSGTFLRPEPPSAPLFSPFKKMAKTSHNQEYQQQQSVQRKIKVPFVSTAQQELICRKPKVTSYAIKEEPPEQLLADPLEDELQLVKKAPTNMLNVITNNKQTISANAAVASSFNLFMNNNSNNPVTSTSTPENAIKNSNTQKPHESPSRNQKQDQKNQSFPQEANEESAPSSQLPQILYKCLECESIFLNQQDRSTHESASHHILYKCGVCERDFEQESGLKKHLKTHRTMDARKDAWKKCPDCGKCLKLGSMWMHRKIHSDSKKYGCEICGQKFVQKINLTHHSRVHTAEKPFECPECQKRFQERSHLQRHQKYHAQTRSYRCEKCGKMYKTERCLKVHNLVHLEQRPFACNVCEKSFISNSKLKQHSNIHTGERPFKCNYCPRDFTNFPNWLKHTRRRHKVDHKTGEHLENIPSYCSKKSSKTAKPSAQQQKSAEVTNNGAVSASTKSEKVTIPTTNATNSINHNAISSLTAVPATLTTAITKSTSVRQVQVLQLPLQSPAASKTQVKRKKKNNAIMVEIPATEVTSEQPVTATLPQAANIAVNLSRAVTRPTLLVPHTAAATKLITNNTITIPVVTASISIKPTASTAYSSNHPNAVAISVNSNNTVNNKAVKVKRERKQPTPKQLQKPLQAPPPPPPPLQLITIKREQPDEKSTVNSCSSSKAILDLSTANQFTDVHCLSMTSAEDFIMEQALEMEESGLYVAPTSQSTVDTDNAISSETAAAFHFKIKNEFGILDDEDEFISLKEANNRVLCSSLESSPYSSPASIELPPVVNTAGAPTVTATTTGLIIPNGVHHMPAGFTVAGNNSTMATNSITAPTTTFFLPPFAALSAHGNIITNHTSAAASMTNTKTTTTSANSTIVQKIRVAQASAAAESATTTVGAAATNEEPPIAHLNSIYFPTSGMPLLVQSNQVLPSVDTLFSTSAANSKFFRVKSLTTQQATGRHNLT